MNKSTTLKEYIGDVIRTNRFAVLATEGNGQPHTSLIAITPFGSFSQIMFATYRNTIKYRNLSNNNKVAVLIESGEQKRKILQKSIVLTIIGHTEEISSSENKAAYQAHLKQHPQLESFMLSPDCVFFKIKAQSFQVVSGIDDIRWITAEDLNAN